MSEAAMIEPLLKAASEAEPSPQAATELVSALAGEAIQTLNARFSLRQLIKRSRLQEPLPINPRQFSSYRTRLGAMLEYALATEMDGRLQRAVGERARLTFVPHHEYPDLFVRNQTLDPTVRIEVKAVDADSDEQSARFEVLQSLINHTRDVVLLLGWKWRPEVINSCDAERPFIFSYVVVPAIDLARERDESVRLRGGYVDDDGIFVASKNDRNKIVRDQGNSGKILRIVHKKRAKSTDSFALSKYIHEYLKFVGEFGS